MATEYAEIRNELKDQGYEVSDEDYRKWLDYTRLKARSAGKTESYVPFLLPDVIRQGLFRRTVTSVSKDMMTLARV